MALLAKHFNDALNFLIQFSIKYIVCLCTIHRFLHHLIRTPPKKAKAKERVREREYCNKFSSNIMKTPSPQPKLSLVEGKKRLLKIFGECYTLENFEC